MRGPRYAEEMFPMKEISEMSASEKSIRQGHISTVHIWWARRPLTSSRAMNYAALIPMPQKVEEIQNKKNFIKKLSKWEKSLDRTILERARKDILDANDGKSPKILDPFAGGGSIPLEAMRLGCETYANDYNPVATLLLKCILEFPQKYQLSNLSTTGLLKQKRSTLSEDIKKWGAWVLEKTKQEIGRFYVENNIGETLVGCIWSRTIPCQNPSCGAIIPLIRQFWLAKNKGKRITLFPILKKKSVDFEIIGDGYKKSIPATFDPDKGTVFHGVVTCVVCGSIVDNETTVALFQNGSSGQRMMAIVTHKKGIQGKRYRVPTDQDNRVFERAIKYLDTKRKDLFDRTGSDPVPDESLPPTGTLGFRVQRYNTKRWGDLFNPRQKLALLTISEKIRNAYQKMMEQGIDPENAKVVLSYLALALDRQADYNSMFCSWVGPGEFIRGTLGRHTVIPMVWDYFELCPWSNATGDWNSALKWIVGVVDHVSEVQSTPVTITQYSATELPYPDNYFDAVFTDPPYYDNVPYSYLSDFFYVWLKRSVGDLYPELFSTSLTPKSKEIVAYSNIEGGFQAAKIFFEDMLKRSFQEISRVLKQNGICYIVYAHKSTPGWETLINSLLDSGLVVTAAWPIDTERKGRMNARETAVLASSIYMIAGKYKKHDIGFYRDIRKDLKTHLNNELDKLWNEGVSGADFLVAAIGSAIEVFGMYEKIIDDEGNVIRADKLLEQIRRIVTDYAVRQVLHNGFASEISQMTRFYLLWRWAYGEAKIQFDDARKLAQSVGVELSHNWNDGFIQKDKEFIRILGPYDRDVKALTDSNELIDILHRVLLLWNSGKGNEVLDVLQQSGLGKNDTFYRIAQAISESLPIESKEKKSLEGFLAGKARISKQIKVESGQRRLFE